MNSAPREGPPARLWAGLVFVVLLVCYGSTLPHTLTDADAGEFLVIARTGGIAHPPGYALYVLILRALALVAPSATLVTVVAGASAVCVALAGAIMVYAFRQRVAAWAMASATVLVGAAPVVWRQANAAEPFALLLLLAACVLWVGVAALDIVESAAPRVLQRRAGMLGLLFGLGFVTHHALALLVPVPLVLLACVAQHADTRRHIPALGAWVVAGFALGCVPAVSLLLADGTAPLVYGDWSSAPMWRTLLRHVLRQDYGTFSLATGHQGAYGQALVAYLRALPTQLLVVGPLLAVAAIPAARRWPRALTIMLVLCVLVAGPVFLWRVNVSPSEEPVVVARFFALPTLLLVPFLGAGLAWLSAGKLPKWGGALVLLLVSALQWHLARPLANRAEERVYEQHVRQLLEVAGRSGHSVLVSASDLHDYGLTYGQQVLGLSPTVPVLMVGLLDVPWYRARLSRILGGPVPSDVGAVTLLDALNTGALLVLADAPEPPRPAFFARAIPLGGAYVVTPPGSAPPSWPDIYAANVELVDAFPVLPDASRTTPLTGWEVRLLQQHRTHWDEVCRALEALSHPDAAPCRQRVLQYDNALASTR
jgi:hypothetical protein